jgi:PIF1-like helicase
MNMQNGFWKWVMVLDTGSQIKLDPLMKCGDTIDSLVDSFYPGLNLIDPKANNDSWFSECTILYPKNDTVGLLNMKYLNSLKGDTLTYHSADAAVTDENIEDGDFQYPAEYLNLINGSGLPLSKLQLEIGAPIKVLWNLDPLMAPQEFCRSESWLMIMLVIQFSYPTLVYNQQILSFLLFWRDTNFLFNWHI